MGALVFLKGAWPCDAADREGRLDHARSPSPELNEDFRAAMRRLASAVGVLTANGPVGPLGMAASSITSLTIEPPSLLVCVNRSATFHSCMNEGRSFCINLLSRDQRDICDAFGSPARRNERFVGDCWSVDPSSKLPVLADAQANIVCVVSRTFPYGTHSIVVGEVSDVRLGGDIAPLIYQNGGYL
ncbi:flavin reductase family protein [Erythrobacter aurantius]|uniref:flavin reductase family protein n=1 Tax=Erythrobacter aurantius TaxID=2909249 RepID=UPI0038B3CC80